MKFKDFITEAKPAIYRHDDMSKWAEQDNPGFKFSEKQSGLICGIGLLEKFAKKNQDKLFTFTYLGKTEQATIGKEFKMNQINKGEMLCRYVSNAIAAAGERHLCILNADKGYMRYMTNIKEDPEIEDAKWSKPEYFRYLRVIY